MIRKLLVRDLTLRDSQKFAFAMRMSQKQIDSVLPFYREAGFCAVEIWGEAVLDSIMRYWEEDPWERLETIKMAIGDTTRLSALLHGRNLLGNNPYPDKIIKDFCFNAMASGLDTIRIFDMLNDVENIKSTIKYVKRFGGTADCAVCYAVDPYHSAVERIVAALHGKSLHKPVFTNDYFLDKALQMESLGADMVTISDASGLLPPRRSAEILRLLKKHLKVPVGLHTHCMSGYALASVLIAIVNGVDVIDTDLWSFAGGEAAPAIELVYVFCKKMGIELDVNMEAITKINTHLLNIRKEMVAFDRGRQLPRSFNPLTDRIPTEIDRFFNDAIDAARKDKEEDLLTFCHAIEAYFGFPLPNDWVRKAQVPEDLYTYIASRLKQLGQSDLLEKAMSLIPQVRMDAGLPPWIAPVSQVVGDQVVACVLDQLDGRPMYSTLSKPFVALVKGEYGKTPVSIDPEFRFKITGSREDIPSKLSDYEIQENPVIEELGVRLAENEKEVLLLELFPMVAHNFLLKKKQK